MKYVLTNWVLGKSPIVNITQKDYEDIHFSQLCLYELLLIEQKYDNIIENYLEYENYLMVIAYRFMMHKDFVWTELRDASNTIQRMIMNLLNSAKAYIDQSKEHLKRILKDDKEIIVKYESFVRQQYDEHLGYRTMVALRNHSQHFNFPAPHLTLNMKRVDRSTHNQLLVSVTPLINVEELQKNKKFKSKILSELNEINKLVDIKPLIREYISCISRTLLFLRDCTKYQKDFSEEKFNWSLSQLRKATKGLSLSNPAAAIENKDGTMRAEIIINDEIITRRVKYEKKNGDISQIVRQFASGEIIEDT